MLLPSQRHPIAFDVAALLVTYVRKLPRASTALRSDDLSGVALSTWILALASALIWGVDTLLVHSLTVGMPTLLRAPLSSVTIVA